MLSKLNADKLYQVIAADDNYDNYDNYDDILMTIMIPMTIMMISR